MSANTYGRQVVLPLVNKSGGQVIAGDVVIVDTTNNDAFTTNTAANFTGGVGIAQETIANNGTGRVLISGYAALVNVNASVTRGDFGATFTVAKQATDAGAARTTGTFCQFLTGGTTPDALVFPVDLGGTALTNPMTGIGDLIRGGAAGLPTRLAPVAAGKILTDGGAGVTPAWGNGPMTTRGDVMTAGVSGAIQRLALGTSGKLLRSDGTDALWAALTTSTNQLGSPVTMTNANQFYDGPALTLSAGTFILIGTVSVDGNNADTIWTGKLWDGTTVASSCNVLAYGGASGRKYSCGTLVGVVVIASGTPTWKISVAGDGTGASILAAAGANSPGNSASTLVAIQIG